MFEENVQYLEKILKTFEDSIKELEELYKTIQGNKEQLKINVQKIFCEIKVAIDKRQDEILLDIENKFKESLKDMISEKFGISKNNLILADPKLGSFQISLFQTDEFNSLSLEQLKNDPK